MIIQERLAEVAARRLQMGSHAESSGDMCVMEAVAYVAGEPWSSWPQCACPAISAFMQEFNDRLPDTETRTRLLAPYIPRLVGTRSTVAVEQRRWYLLLDWRVRVSAPEWLDTVLVLRPHAEALRALPRLDSESAAMAAVPTIAAAERAARDVIGLPEQEGAADVSQSTRQLFANGFDVERAARKAAQGPRPESEYDTALALVEAMLAVTDEATH